MIPAAAPRLVPPGSTPRDAGLSTHPGLGLAVCWRSCSPGQAEGILMERLKIAARTAVRQPRPDHEIHPLPSGHRPGDAPRVGTSVPPQSTQASRCGYAPFASGLARLGWPWLTERAGAD